MLAVPPAILEFLHQQAGATVGMKVDHGRPVVEAKPRPRHSLDELLAQCHASAEPATEDRVWLDSPAAFSRPTRTPAGVRCDQPRAIDMRARNGHKLQSAPASIMDEAERRGQVLPLASGRATHRSAGATLRLAAETES